MKIKRNESILVKLISADMFCFLITNIGNTHFDIFIGRGTRRIYISFFITASVYGENTLLMVVIFTWVMKLLPFFYIARTLLLSYQRDIQYHAVKFCPE